VAVWLDSFRIYTADKALNPDLKGPCTTGHFRPAEFLETDGKMDGTGDPKSVYVLKNSSGLPALESWSGCHIFDHSNAKARAYWTQMCLNMTRTGVIDGCGADASWQDGVDQAKGWGLTPAAAAAWDAGHKQMMRETTAALGDGVLLGKDPWELVEGYVSGALHEGCAATEATILTLQNLTSIAKRSGKRLVYQAHGKGSVDEIAAFLIGAGPHQYYGCGGWNMKNAAGAKAHRPPILDKRLGAPKADGKKDQASGVWSREFAHAKVTFNAKSNKGTVGFDADRDEGAVGLRTK